MVVVTNAPRPNAELLLSGLGIARRFKAVVIGDELAHGKPHPLPYLEGLRLAGALRRWRSLRLRGFSDRAFSPALPPESRRSGCAPGSAMPI